MAVLNVTYNGASQNVAELAYETGDDDVKRMAAEAMSLAPGVFANFVVDRFEVDSGQTVYLRPKVPFGADVENADENKMLLREQDVAEDTPHRLFTGPHSEWTQEGLDLAHKVATWAQDLMDEYPDVCPRDLGLVFIEATSTAALELSIRRRLA